MAVEKNAKKGTNIGALDWEGAPSVSGCCVARSVSNVWQP